MADSFGLKIGLEGEKEFKSALVSINQSFKVLGSEMKLVESQFDKNDNSIQALTARNEVLQKSIDAQKQKIETLRSALANAAESFGENDRRTQNWQIQLNNAQAELNKMEKELDANTSALDIAGKKMDDVAKSADDMGNDIEDAGKSAEKSESKFSGLESVLKGIGAAMVAVGVATTAMAVKLGKEVISAYADYEQLVGGVKTLFGTETSSVEEYAKSVGKTVDEVRDEYNSLLNAQQKVMNDADNAYKTAGLSANEYMETVTSFSASLIASLNGDTEAAANKANQAIVDMADNANKMGTDMSMIHSAYQGFAKQNYTMLDNLKLGYGGTKTEMERLLADASEIAGVEFSIDSYADIVDAIHIIQTQMGITGTTAKEAEYTITGSINSLKSALQNLITGFGNSEADIRGLCDNVVDGFKTVVKNITPIIGNIISALPTAVDALIDAVGDLLPTFLTMVTKLFSEVLETLLNLLPSLVPAVMDALLTIVNTLIKNLPLIINVAAKIVISLASGIAKSMPKLIPTIVQAVIEVCETLIANLPMLLDTVLQIVEGLVKGILEALPIIIDALPKVILAIINFILGAIPQIIEAGIKLFTSLIGALPDIIEAIIEAIPLIIDGIINAIVENLPLIIDAGINLFVTLIQALPEIIEMILTAIPKIITSIVGALIDNIPLIIQAGIDLFTSLITNLPMIIMEIVKAVPQILSAIINGFNSGFSQMADVGKNLVHGLWEGIQSLAGWIWDKVSNWAGDLWSGIKSFFGIHSPSKKMAWIGDMMMEGLANGIDETASEVLSSANGMVNNLNNVFDGLSADMSEIPSDFNVSSAADSINGGTKANQGGLVLQLSIGNFNNYSNEDITSLTEEIMETAGNFAKRKGVVFA